MTSFNCLSLLHLFFSSNLSPPPSLLLKRKKKKGKGKNKGSEDSDSDDVEVIKEWNTSSRGRNGNGEGRKRQASVEERKFVAVLLGPGAGETACLSQICYILLGYIYIFDFKLQFFNNYISILSNLLIIPEFIM